MAARRLRRHGARPPRGGAQRRQGWPFDVLAGAEPGIPPSAVMFIERIDATARSALLRVGIADLPHGSDPVLWVGDVRIPRMVAPTRRADAARVVAFAVPIELLEGEPVLTLEAGSERIELPVPQRRSLRGVDAVRQGDARVRALQSRVTDLTEQVRDQGTELPADGAVEPKPEADGQERDRLAVVEARADALNHELETVRHEAVATAERLQHELAEATDVAQRTAAELEGVAEELAQARADLAAQAAQPPEPQGVPLEEVAEMERRLGELDELRLQAEQRAHTTAIALTALLQRAERADVLEREMAELRIEFTALGELLVETREAFEH